MHYQDIIQSSYLTGSLVLGWILWSIPMYSIATRLGEPNAWMAFVPLLNLVLLFQIGQKPIWWIIFLFLCPCVWWVMAAIAWGTVAERVNKPPIMGYLCMVPFFHLFMPLVVAFA